MIWKLFVVVSIVCYSFSCYALAKYAFNEEVGIFYKLHTTGKTWGEASQICRNEGGFIAMPSNKNEMNAIQSITIDYFESNQTNDPVPTHILMGFHDVFEQREFVTEMGKALQFAFNEFAPHEPNNIKENCGSAKLKLGKLNDFSCNLPTIFVCQKELATQLISSYDDMNVFMSLIRECPFALANNYTWMTGQPSHWGYINCGAVQQKYFKPKQFKSVYKLHLTATSWATARTICEAEGGHLAIIDNAAEHKYLADMFNDTDNQVTYSKNNAFWLGFHDLFTTGDFVTVIGTSLSYNEDNFNKSSTHCGAMDKEGILKTMDCNLSLRFFCEKEILVDTECIEE